MNTLYVIGNGFDLHHELKTLYKHFAHFLKAKEPDVYELLLNYYYLPDLDPENPDRQDEKEKEILWADFENTLAELDYNSVLDDNSDLIANPAREDFRDRDWHSFQIEMEMIVKKLTRDLFSIFREFILNVVFPENIDEKRVQLNIDSLFLSFNYTDTLEKYYNVDFKNILYIHGKAKNIDDRIILGHAIDPLSFRLNAKTPPSGLSEEQLQEWQDMISDEYDYSFESAREEILGYFKAAYKHTQDIIKNQIKFFEQLKSTKNIYVLGHSISQVDLPYFKKIIESTKQNKPHWHISYLWDDEKMSMQNKIVALGVRLEDISMLRISDLVFNHPTLF